MNAGQSLAGRYCFQTQGSDVRHFGNANASVERCGMFARPRCIARRLKVVAVYAISRFITAGIQGRKKRRKRKNRILKSGCISRERIMSGCKNGEIMQRKKRLPSMSDELQCYENLSRSGKLAELIYMRGLDRVVMETKTPKSQLYSMIELTMPFSNSVLRYIEKP